MTMDDIDRMNRLKDLEEKADAAYQATFDKKSSLGDLTASDEERQRRIDAVLKDVENGTPNNTAATVDGELTAAPEPTPAPEEAAVPSEVSESGAQNDPQP